jgi:hypothetical protein
MKFRSRRHLHIVPKVRTEIISEFDSMAAQATRIAYLLQLIIGGWLAFLLGLWYII